MIPDRVFFRLIYTDTPTTDPEGDDFDGDNYSNMEEIEAGSDPFNIEDTPRPASPTGLSARTQADGTNHIEWLDNSDNETGFTISYSIDGGENWFELTSTAADTETVTINDTFDSGSRFQVAATNSAGSGYTGESESSTVIPLPPLSYALIEVGAFDPTDESKIIDIGKSGQILWRVGEEKDSRLLFSNWSNQSPDTLYRYFSLKETELIDFYLNRHNSTIDDVYFPNINGSYPDNIELFADGVVIFSTRADTVTVNSNINAENLLKIVSFSNGTSVVEDYFDPMIQNQLVEIETTESGRVFGYWKDVSGHHPIDHDTDPGIRIEVNSDGNYSVTGTHADNITVSPDGSILSTVTTGEPLYHLNNQGLRWYSISPYKIIFPTTQTEYTDLPSLSYVSSDPEGDWIALTNDNKIWTRRPNPENPGEFLDAFDGPYELSELLNQASEWTNFGATHMNAAGMIATTAEKVVDGVPTGNHYVVLLLNMNITAHAPVELIDQDGDLQTGAGIPAADNDTASNLQFVVNDDNDDKLAYNAANYPKDLNLSGYLSRDEDDLVAVKLQFPANIDIGTLEISANVDSSNPEARAYIVTPNGILKPTKELVTLAPATSIDLITASDTDLLWELADEGEQTLYIEGLTAKDDLEIKLSFKMNGTELVSESVHMQLLPSTERTLKVLAYSGMAYRAMVHMNNSDNVLREDHDGYQGDADRVTPIAFRQNDVVSNLNVQSSWRFVDANDNLKTSAIYDELIQQGYNIYICEDLYNAGGQARFGQEVMILGKAWSKSQTSGPSKGVLAHEWLHAFSSHMHVNTTDDIMWGTSPLPEGVTSEDDMVDRGHGGNVNEDQYNHFIN